MNRPLVAALAALVVGAIYVGLHTGDWLFVAAVMASMAAIGYMLYIVRHMGRL
ncbi:MAG: hypothetical protein ACK4SY_10690 [Pyrobaculum sp.]